MTNRKPIVWTIAGSDSGGGAGIQADMATIADLGGHACTVITCVTAQNSVAVNGVEAVSDKMLRSQLDTLLADMPPAAIKIGLLANQRQVNLVANWLATALTAYRAETGRDVAVIVDPVMVASCSDVLLASPQPDKLDLSSFSALIDLLTPNAGELLRLSAAPLADLACGDADLIARAKTLAEKLDTQILVTGGDEGELWCENKATDLYVCREVSHISPLHQHRHYLLSTDRVANSNHHGCGCTLSSAIACFMAHGLVMHDAILLGKAYVQQGIEFAEAIGKGAGPLHRGGWPQELDALAVINAIDSGPRLPAGLSFAPLILPIGVYPVVEQVSQLASLLAAGATTIQLRIKAETCDEGVEQKVIDAIALGREYRAQVFINDHWQLALEHGAFGVHLGQEDLYDADLRAIANAGMALGVSSHGYFEMSLASQIKPSYIALGHIYPTPTKQMPSNPQGLGNLRRYAQLLKNVCPTVAIGGIDLNRIEAVKRTGVDAVAVVRAITEASSPTLAYQALRQRWEVNDGAQ